MKGLISKVMQSYGDKKLQTKFTLVMLLLVLLPALFIAYLFLGNIYEMVVSYTIRQEQDASADTAPLIAEKLQDVLDAAEHITTLDFYAALFHQPVEGTLEDYAETADAKAFRQEIDTLIEETSVTGVRLYLGLGDRDSSFFSGTYTEGVFYPESVAGGTYWHGIFAANSGLRELYCPAIYLGPSERTRCGDLAYIKKTSLYFDGESYSAYLAVYFSGSELAEILSDNLSLEGSVSYILNERDALVASSDTSLSGIYWLSYDTIQGSFMSSNNFIAREILGETIYSGFYHIAGANWFMVTVLPSGPLIDRSNALTLQFGAVYLAFALIAFYLALRLSRSITGRLSGVVERMQTVRQGPPVPMDSPRYHDEVGDLIDTYNYMARKMNQLIERQRRDAEDLRIAEFHSLQAQMNPHFLYNTMDMINWMAQAGQTDQISDAVQKLSRFYRLTLSRKANLVTIADELEHASIYVELQNMRYRDQIQLIVDIPDALMDYTMPKLTLQPVVENSILHGILEKPGKSGSIVLTGWMENGDITLMVSDDGVGISPELLPSILSGDGKTASGGTNIAVCNTHRRLQILYGDSYGLAYTSALGRGTDVEIRIPANSRSAERFFTEDARLERSADLLKDHDISLYQIVESCGFRNQEEFERLFLKKFGVTPARYREQFW